MLNMTMKGETVSDAVQAVNSQKEGKSLVPGRLRSPG